MIPYQRKDDKDDKAVKKIMTILTVLSSRKRKRITTTILTLLCAQKEKRKRNTQTGRVNVMNGRTTIAYWKWQTVWIIPNFLMIHPV